MSLVDQPRDKRFRTNTDVMVCQIVAIYECHDEDKDGAKLIIYRLVLTCKTVSLLPNEEG